MEDKQFDTVQLKGRTFHIHKFPARKVHVVVKFMSVVRGKAKNMKDIRDSGGAELMELFGEIDSDTFEYLQNGALSAVYEKLPDNPMVVPVINPEGNFGVPHLEDDMNTVFQLMVIALLFNFESFLSESPSEG